MSTDDTPQATVGLVLPWATMTLDNTERVAALIPEDKLAWRLDDPSGKWHFSLAEIVMHCADARLMFARQLEGNESEEGFWSTGPAEDGVWPFRPYAGKEEILESLRSARTALRPYLDRPASALTETTEGTRGIFQKAITRMKEKGMDTSAAELRGPANLVRVLMAVAVHESGHKSTLQTLLRMHGINLEP